MDDHKKTVLLADDDQEDQELLEEILLGLDPQLQVRAVFNGQEALQYLEECEYSALPCLIILDYNMPELSGVDTLLELCKTPHLHSIPKIIWSTSSTQTYMVRSLECGALAYFVKPSDINGLETIAKKMLSFCKPSA
jgi:CheY-like chemotaxis protein